MPAILTFLLLLLSSYTLLAQSQVASSSPYTSIRHAESTFYRQFQFRSEAQVDSFAAVMQGEIVPSHAKITSASTATAHQDTKDNTCTLQKKVYGYHPYWVSSAAAANYQYDLLSTFIYFSYELQPTTGSYSDIHFWRTTNSINLAQAAGCRIELCVTNFGSADNTTFLTNSAAWDRLIDSLVVLLPIRQASGVNIDFEGVPAAQRNNFRAFMQHLHERLNEALPGTQVSVAMPAVDWNNIFNLTDMDPYIDAFIIMGYDYHYAGDEQAGPIAPMYWGDQWGELSLYRSLNDYLAESVSPQKLIMAVPYYGYDWITAAETIPSATTATANSRTYAYLRENFYDTYTRQWNEDSQSPYFIYISGGNTRQCWFEDEVSLGNRYDMVNSRNIGGTGMWALGYDNGYSQLWDVLREKFTDCGTPCPLITVYDTGGSLGQYRNNENYTINLVSPDGESPITATFTAFDMEDNFDFVRVYDGNSTAATLLGTLTGTTLPAAFTSTGTSLTLQVTTDNATRREGFALQWSCSCSPTAAILPITAPVSASELTVSFVDTDNCGGNITQQFYQALHAESGTTDWRGNGQRGFFNDNFDGGTLSGEWLAESGTWIYDDGSVQQIAEANDNTNLYTSLVQTPDKTWLYHWRMKISGTGSSRRAGLHIFASDGDAENRGNSYFVYLRADDNKVQLYEVSNNVFTLKTNDNASILPNTWLDCKLIYNPADGTLHFYLNNALASSWIDSSPLTSGNYLSLRTAGCEANYDFVSVFQSRGNMATITIGNTAGSDIWHTGTGSPQVRITSIARNTTHFTNIAFTDAQFGTAVGINAPDLSNTISLSIYPNPADSYTYLHIVSPYTAPQSAIVRIYDMNGKMVGEQYVGKIAGGEQTINLPIAHLSAGQYLVSLQTEQDIYTQKLLVY